MRTNRLVLTVVAIFGLFLLAGCKGESDVNASNTEIKGGSATKMEAGDNVNQSSAQVVNSPGDIKEGGSYKIEPPDPNDPKFKADPKLAGGG